MSPEPDQPDHAADRLPRYCRQCDGEFAALPNSRRIYCSPRCSDLAHRPEPGPAPVKDCPVCGTEFTHGAKIRQVYSSPACRREAERIRDRGRDEERARRLGEVVPPRSVEPAPATRPQPPRSPAARVQDPLVPTAVRNCPHCDQPVTIVALLATAEAARPTITQPSSEVIALRRG